MNTFIARQEGYSVSELGIVRISGENRLCFGVEFGDDKPLGRIAMRSQNPFCIICDRYTAHTIGGILQAEPGNLHRSVRWDKEQ